MNASDQSDGPPDLKAHAQTAVSAYLRVQPFYQDLASLIGRLIQECLRKRAIKVHSVQYRAKDPSSFEQKAATPSEANPQNPLYAEPLRDITDLAGVRVITHFPNTLADIDKLLSQEFEILERSDKAVELFEDERFGYQSVHYLLRLKPDRARLAEYERFAGSTAEVQVRTILQHAWAEIEHDIQYKSSNAIPSAIRRRFMSLAGMLEVADREFQAIQDADKELETHANAMVQKGDLGGVEITPNSLKAFLDKHLGPDGRISDWSYEWSAGKLKRLGFQDLRQVEAAISPYDDDKMSHVVWGSRMGQEGRFVLMICAALGERCLREYPWAKSSFAKFVDAGIPVGTYSLPNNELTPEPTEPVEP